MARHANDVDIWLNVRDVFPHPYSLADAKGWIARIAGQNPVTVFVIEVDGEAAGTIGLHRRHDVQRLSAEVGYWLGRAFWGRGIVTDALRAVSRYGFETLGLVRIDALSFAHNAASRRVLAKAGFVEEGVLRKAVIKNGEILDTVMCALTV
jgi:RimJ/RimL family protein N-acetyltransferase